MDLTEEAPSPDDIPKLVLKLRRKEPHVQRSVARAFYHLVAEDAALSAAVVRAGAVPGLQAWAATSGVDREVLRTALRALSLIGTTEIGAHTVGNEQFLRLLASLTRAKDRDVHPEVASCLLNLSIHEIIRQQIHELEIEECAIVLSKAKTAAIKIQGLSLLCRFCISDAIARRVVEIDAEALERMLFENAEDPNADIERWAMVAIGRLCKVPEFAMRVGLTDRLDLLIKNAREMPMVPLRKQIAAYALAELAGVKECRDRLIRHHIIHLFVSMGGLEARRADMSEFQEIAAKGLRNFCGAYRYRALLGTLGAIEVAIKMLVNSGLSHR